jgi:hypothetical protein
LAVSAREWWPSASIDEEPDIYAAKYLKAAITRLPSSAATTALVPFAAMPRSYSVWVARGFSILTRAMRRPAICRTVTR